MLRIVVGMGSCGVAAGAGRVKDALERAGAKPGITGCVGACYLEPIVDLYEGAELRRRLPRIITWCPSTVASVPRRIISSTNRKRDSKTFSVRTLTPSLTLASAIAMGCRSVGKPGNGRVW